MISFCLGPYSRLAVFVHLSKSRLINTSGPIFSVYYSSILYSVYTHTFKHTQRNTWACVEEVNASPFFNFFSTDAREIRHPLLNSRLLLYGWRRFISICTRVLPMCTQTWYVLANTPSTWYIHLERSRKSWWRHHRRTKFGRELVLPTSKVTWFEPGHEVHHNVAFLIFT